MNTHTAVYLSLALFVAQPLCAQTRYSADEQLKTAPKGEIRSGDVDLLRQCDRETAKLLAAAPDDASGKQSHFYPKLRAWSVSLHELTTSRKQTDAFKMIPLMADVFKLSRSEGVSDELDQARNQMSDCGYSLIMAAGAYIQQHGGKVDAATLSSFVTLFSTRGFDLEPDWEDQTRPITPAGLMIVNPDEVIKQLKSRPWQEARRFLGGNSSVADFFATYAPDGDGLAVLKTKYAREKNHITAKFKELAAWEARQERSSLLSARRAEGT